jgi:hypothetical protein
MHELVTQPGRSEATASKQEINPLLIHWLTHLEHSDAERECHVYTGYGQRTETRFIVATWRASVHWSMFSSYHASMRHGAAYM